MYCSRRLPATPPRRRANNNPPPPNPNSDIDRVTFQLNPMGPDRRADVVFKQSGGDAHKHLKVESDQNLVCLTGNLHGVQLWFACL